MEIIFAHSGIREIILFSGSQLVDCGVSVLLEEFLQLRFAMSCSPRILWCLMRRDTLHSAFPGVGVLQNCLLFSRA